MKKHMKYSLFSKVLTAVVAVCALAITSCTEKDEELVADYGYVQFKLYKNETAPMKSATRGGEDLQDETLEYVFYLRNSMI